MSSTMGRQIFKYVGLCLATITTFVVIKLLSMWVACWVLARFFSYMMMSLVQGVDLLSVMFSIAYGNLLSSIVAAAMASWPKWNRGGYLLLPALHIVPFACLYFIIPEMIFFDTIWIADPHFAGMVVFAPAISSSMTALMVTNRRRKVCLDWHGRPG